MEFLFLGGKPNGSRRTDAVPVGALEKKGQGLIHELEVMERNGMASFTSDDDAFLEKGQGSRQTIGL